jgi:hypothetical protein
MAEAVLEATAEGAPQRRNGATSPGSSFRRYSTAIVLLVVFLILLASRRGCTRGERWSTDRLRSRSP